jgi:hypothetical protein
MGRLLPNAAATNQWQVTGANAGTLDGVINFSSVQEESPRRRAPAVNRAERGAARRVLNS